MSASVNEKTVLVTGASGFLGGALARQLAANGVKVRALVRRPDRDRYIRGIGGIEIAIGDVTEIEQMRQAARGCEYVFHAAAATGGPPDLQHAVNVEGTKNVLRAAAEAGAKRFVHVSTIAVYGYRCTADVTEDTPLNPGRDAYQRTKAAAEREMQQLAAELGLSFSIVRPGMIYGPRSNTWTKRFFKWARRKPVIFIGTGRGSAYPIHVDDVVDLMILLATHSAAHNEAFNCTPDPSPTFREFLTGYARLAGHERWLGIAPLLVKPFAHLLALTRPTGDALSDAPDLVDFSQRYITYRMQKARDLLGWQARISLPDGIAGCAPYLREKGLLP